ncbi:MAG: type II toxin-antitoxin system VapC family toxin [Gammaproteobacteria bacterium]
MILVLDASVTIKWLLRGCPEEADTEYAASVWQAAVEGRFAVTQPTHWLPEVAGALARLSPQTAEEDIEMLQALNLPVAKSPSILPRACRLAVELNHHLFDTLYHALALETEGAVLITADRRYLNNARHLGGIVDLSQWAEVIGARL